MPPMSRKSAPPSRSAATTSPRVARRSFSGGGVPSGWWSVALTGGGLLGVEGGASPYPRLAPAPRIVVRARSGCSDGEALAEDLGEVVEGAEPVEAIGVQGPQVRQAADRADHVGRLRSRVDVGSKAAVAYTAGEHGGQVVDTVEAVSADS